MTIGKRILASILIFTAVAAACGLFAVEKMMPEAAHIPGIRIHAGRLPVIRDDNRENDHAVPEMQACSTNVFYLYENRDFYHAVPAFEWETVPHRRTFDVMLN